MSMKPYVRREITINTVEKVDLDATSTVSKLSCATSLVISVVSYNILCQKYIKHSLYPYASKSILKIGYRMQNLMREIEDLKGDILCFQEMESDLGWRKKLKSVGYEGILQTRNGNKKEGCAIFWKENKLRLAGYNSVFFNKLAEKFSDSKYKRDNIGLIVRLIPDLCDHPVSGKERTQPICIANTHLFWNPQFPEVKLEQMKMFLEEIELFNKDFEDVPLILTGDFNSLPNSNVYQLLVCNTSSKEEMTELQNANLCKEHQDISSSVPSLLETVDTVSSGSDTEAILLEKKTSAIEDTFESEACPCFKFSRKLQSAYNFHSEKGEPEFTNFKGDFQGTLDYIFFEKNRFLLLSILDIPSLDLVALQTALPNRQFSSDHVALKATFLVLPTPKGQ